MTKATFNFNRAYIFDPSRSGAKYSLNDGENWVNHGEFAEVMLKSVLGYAAVKDACGAYDVTDDIPELNMSVKSSKATLVNRPLGYDFNSFKDVYFHTCHSTKWAYVSTTTESLTVYYMDRDEFESFIDNWATFTADRKVIRFKEESNKMLRWLDERAD